MTENIIKSFRVTMTAEEYQVFTAIKDRLGLRADAEVLRYLINYYSQRELPKERKDPKWIKVEEGWID